MAGYGRDCSVAVQGVIDMCKAKEADLLDRFSCCMEKDTNKRMIFLNYIYVFNLMPSTYKRMVEFHFDCTITSYN